MNTLIVNFVWARSGGSFEPPGLNVTPPMLSFPTEAHLGFAQIGSDLGFVGVEFCLNNEIESNRLELYVEIEFIVLNLEHRNQVYCTRDVSFLNSFENVQTNKIV